MLDRVLTKIVSQIPDCVAAGYVDMDSGLLIEAKTVDSHPQEVLEVVAAATGELFQGKTVMLIEQMFDKSRGITGTKYFQDIIIRSENLVHIFLRGKIHTQTAFVVVCSKSVNMGMALHKAKSFLNSVEKST